MLVSSASSASSALPVAPSDGAPSDGAPARALGPLLSATLPAALDDDTDPVDPSALCDELATTHFGLHGILSSGFYVPAEAFSDRRAFQPASSSANDVAQLPAGLELAMSHTSQPVSVLLHPIPAPSLPLLAGFLPLTLSLPHVLPVHSLAADANAKHYLVATPYGRGSLREMLAEWSAAAATSPSMEALPIRPTQRLVLTWSLDLLCLVRSWHARLDLGTLSEPVQVFLAGRVLPLAPEHCYIASGSLHLQLDVLPLLMDDGMDRVGEEEAVVVNARLAVEVVQVVAKACVEWKASVVQAQVAQVIKRVADKVNSKDASGSEVEEALGEAVTALEAILRA